MNRFRSAFPSLCLLLALSTVTVGTDAGGQEAARSEPPADHVLLVSIDGFRPDFYLDPSWPAPVLQRLAARGVRAEGVESVFPTVTYPSHTTIVTGALPARHGILYNTPFEPNGQSGRWYWEEASIRVPTLWDAVRTAGLTSASFSWPASVGAPIDWNLPEVWSLEDGYGAVRAIRDATTPGLFEELESEAVGVLSDTDVGNDWFTREMRTAMMAAHVVETRAPNLMTVHLIAADHFQHDDGRRSHGVERAVAMVDAAVGVMVDAYERAGLTERTAVIVTGDHGFIDIHSVLAPNVWLVEAGLMEARRDRGDWRATFHTTGGSAFLRLRNPNDRDAERRVHDRLATLPAAHRDLFRVLERDELDSLGADPDAVLALAPIPGVAISASPSGPVLRPGGGGTHGYLPELPLIHTGLVASGSGVARDRTVHEMGLVHVAPFVAALLGVELPATDGALLPGLIARD